MPPKGWIPPEGFDQTGLLIRQEYYRKIKAVAARTNKKPWQVLDQVLARGLEGIEVPPAIDLDALFKSAKKKRPNG